MFCNGRQLRDQPCYHIQTHCALSTHYDNYDNEIHLLANGGPAQDFDHLFSEFQDGLDLNVDRDLKQERVVKN